MENRGVGYKTDMERGRKKEERKNTPSSPLHSTAHTFTAFTHSLLTLWPHARLRTHTFFFFFTVTQDAYLPHAHILLVFCFPSPSQSVSLFFSNTHTHTHHSGVTGVVSWRECVGDLGVITAWLPDSSDDDIQCFELLWPGPAPNTTRQYTLSTSQPCIYVV